MITIAGFQFPDSSQDKWEPIMMYVALHSRVLLVARTRVEGAWSCYCTPVPGQSHYKEQHLWQTEGVKLPENLARAAFGYFENLPYD